MVSPDCAMYAGGGSNSCSGHGTCTNDLGKSRGVRESVGVLVLSAL